MLYRFIILISLFLTNIYHIQAQLILQVVSKKVETSFSLNEGEELNIEAVQADIIIQSSEKKEVSLELEFIAKHSESSLAEAAIKQIQYRAERIGKSIYLGNTIPNTKSNTHIRAVYNLRVPLNCILNISNELGKINITNIAGVLILKGKLCQFKLADIKGDIEIDSQLGDIEIDNISGDVNLKISRAILQLTKPTGNYHLQGLYSELNVTCTSDDADLDLDIHGDRSNIYLENPFYESRTHQLEVQHGSLLLPLDSGFKQTKNQAIYKPPKSKGNIRAYTSFGDIVLK